MTIHEFLRSQGRKIVAALGDGNCLFRCFSFHLFGTDEYYWEFRTMTVRFEMHNEVIFQQFLMPVNRSTFKEHTQYMMEQDHWATHIELLAVSCYFQVPIFFCCSTPGSGPHWQTIQPLRHSFRYPDLAW